MSSNHYEMIWIGIGLMGQAFFSMRFLLQWLFSERAKRSIIPVAFWYFSILGGATLLIYAIHRRDPVFIVGQASGLLIYVRNLHMIAGEKRNNHGIETPEHNEPKSNEKDT